MKTINKTITNTPELQDIIDRLGASVVLVAVARSVENSLNKFNLTEEEKELARKSYVNDLKTEFKSLKRKS